MLIAPTSYNFFGVVVTQSFLMWVFIGLVAGWLAGKIGRGRGFGCLVDIILGMVGAVLGGWIFSKLGIQGSGLLFSIAAATVGAVVLVLVARVFSSRGRED
jgi:uncharacterized membrane protein YeaQ/YmgE (transglycosylase-associated protein family)